MKIQVHKTKRFSAGYSCMYLSSIDNNKAYCCKAHIKLNIAQSCTCASAYTVALMNYYCQIKIKQNKFIGNSLICTKVENSTFLIL